MDPAEEYIETVTQKYRHSLIGTDINTPIRRAYDGRTVFVTGGSGFLGKQLLEKLFRTCNIKKAYVLLRPKKGKSVQERLDCLVKDAVFDEVKKVDPAFSNRLTALEGDVQDLGLGINNQDWCTLAGEVEIIFHAAATINFEEHIKLATLTNVRGTREVIRLARDCKKLLALVHVSTAYSQATKQRINQEVKEDFYENTVPPHLLIEMAEVLDNETLEKAAESLRRNWPNTYTFTKAVAESLLKEVKDLPISIVRPAIVINSYREPHPGWLDYSTVYGASGLVLGGGLGVMHVLFVDKNAKIDMVPVDYVNNAIIAAGYAAMTENETKIYTLATKRNFATWEQKHSYLFEKMATTLMTPKCLWYCFLYCTDNILVYTVLSWLMHHIPCYVLDFVMRCAGKPAIFIKINNKASKLSSVLKYFTTNDWDFEDENTLKLYNSLTKEDRRIFQFNMENVNWEELMILWGLGIRMYCVKDGLKGSVYGTKKQAWLRIVHYIFSVIYLTVLYLIFKFIFLALVAVLRVMFT